MAEFIKLQIVEIPELLLVGKELRYSMEEQMKGNNPLPAFWDKCFSEDLFGPLEAQADAVYDDAYVGAMRDWKRGDGMFSYVVGMMMKPSAQIPEGYVSYPVAPAKVAVGWVRGADAADVCSIAHQETEKALKTAGYRADDIDWCMEVYACPRFTTPDENGQITLDYWIPVE